MSHRKDNKELVVVSGGLERSKYICCGADDNTEHLYTVWMAVPHGGKGRHGVWERPGFIKALLVLSWKARIRKKNYRS